MKVIPRDFDIRIDRRGGPAVILTITDIGGTDYFVPIGPDYADELGRQLLAGALALNGRLA
ncbi:hypothetical protein QN239_19260 [Mycolicibacterium sp. Y3]